MKYFQYLCKPNVKQLHMHDINRLKILLAEKGKTNKWLSEQLGVDSTTVSKWCTNSSQPSVEMIFRMMKVLDADINQVINIPPKKQASGVSA